MSSSNLPQLLRDAKAEARNTKGKRVSKAIAMFDLSGSTSLKLTVGHTLATRAALVQTIVCRKIANARNGIVIKELGDGVLLAFDDAVDACRAAIEIEKVTRKIRDCSTKAGLTFGFVEEVNIGGALDVLGTTVDRCARLQAAALPGQILIDKALYDSIASFLKDNQDVSVSLPTNVVLKGIGETEIYELSKKELGFVGWQQPFSFQEDGRLSIQDKVKFMRCALSEIIELGVGLTTFSGYFSDRRSAEFKDHVIDLLRHGVKLKCYVLDPNSRIAEMYAEDRKEINLVQEIRDSIKKLQLQSEEFSSLNLKGSLEVFVYNSLPYFHVMCVDPETDNGRMTVSQYMPGIARAEMPIMQFSKTSNPKLFSKYLLSLKNLDEKSSFIAQIPKNP